MSIEYFEAKPNKGFPPELTALIRFARSDAPVDCPVCHQKQTRLWTMLCPFHAAIFGKHVATLRFEPETHPPLTLVCSDHPIICTDAIRIAIEGGDRNAEPSTPTKS